MSVRLLLVEDDSRIVSFLQRGLEAEGYDITVASDGRQALELARSGDFALIILDRILPVIDGLGVCQILREEGNRSLILMLTARDTLQDKIDGLKGGADDYLTKPFAFDEVIARIEALLRRSGPHKSRAILQCDDLRLDLAAKIAWRGERKIMLTAREFALLEYLMANAGTVVSRETLLKDVWGLGFDPGTNVVDVCILYLRRKIDEGESRPLIQTVRGFGFTIASPD
jgi:two-component system, OmpR family, response regulator